MNETGKRPVSPINGQPLPRGKPFEQGEKQREVARRAGEKSAQVRKERKTLREELLALIAVDITDKNGKTMNTQTAMSTAMIKKAISGDVRAFEMIRDTIGEKPAENVMVSVPDSKVMDEVREYLKGVHET